MKKLLFLFLTLATIAIFLGSAEPAAAAAAGCHAVTRVELDEGGQNQVRGIVPCGIARWPNPLPQGAPQGAIAGDFKCPCTLDHLFIMILKIYNLILIDIAIPLAGILVVIGGVTMVVSAGNPALLDKGKAILKGAIIGIFLIFSAWVIMNIVFTALGYGGSWFAF